MTEIRRCLFCGTEKGLKSREHIIPESLGNKTLIIKKRLCKDCNNFFSDFDNYFCQHHFGSLEKLNYLDKTKKGKTPSVPLLDGIASRDKDGKVFYSQSYLKSENKFKLTFTDKVELYYPINFPLIDPKKISRFLAKCGIEILCCDKKHIAYAYSNKLDTIREYARYNKKDVFFPFLWRKNHETVIDGRYVKGSSREKGDFYFSYIKLPGCEYWFPMDRFDETHAFKLLARDYGMQIIDSPEMIKPKLNFNFIWQ